MPTEDHQGCGSKPKAIPNGKQDLAEPLSEGQFCRTLEGIWAKVQRTR